MSMLAQANLKGMLKRRFMFVLYLYMCLGLIKISYLQKADPLCESPHCFAVAGASSASVLLSPFRSFGQLERIFSSPCDDHLFHLHFSQHILPFLKALPSLFEILRFFLSSPMALYFSWVVLVHVPTPSFQ